MLYAQEHGHHHSTTVVYENQNPSSYQSQPYGQQQHVQQQSYSPYSPYSGAQGGGNSYPAPPPQPSYVS